MPIAQTIDATCSPRIAWAGARVERGEWASGHAIASGLLTCARQTNCPMRDDCACAAEKLLCSIRRLLDS